MKRFDDLTEQELQALTDQQVEGWIDRESALEGVPLPPPYPGPAPEPPEQKKDVTLYQVGGFSFLTMEEATKVVELVRSLRPVKSAYPPGRYDYSNQVWEDAGSVDVSTSEVWDPATFSRVRHALEAYQTQLDSWKQAKKEYDEAVGAREVVAKRVRNAVEEARERQRVRNDLVRRFKRYLELAEGNPSVAWNFLVSAHPTAPDSYPDLRGELVPGVASDSVATTEEEL